jgi:hypothetical protein
MLRECIVFGEILVAVEKVPVDFGNTFCDLAPFLLEFAPHKTWKIRRQAKWKVNELMEKIFIQIIARYVKGEIFPLKFKGSSTCMDIICSIFTH